MESEKSLMNKCADIVITRMETPGMLLLFLNELHEITSYVPAGDKDRASFLIHHFAEYILYYWIDGKKGYRADISKNLKELYDFGGYEDYTKAVYSLVIGCLRYSVSLGENESRMGRFAQGFSMLFEIAGLFFRHENNALSNLQKLSNDKQ